MIVIVLVLVAAVFVLLFLFLFVFVFDIRIRILVSTSNFFFIVLMSVVTTSVHFIGTTHLLLPSLYPPPPTHPTPHTPHPAINVDDSVPVLVNDEGDYDDDTGMMVVEMNHVPYDEWTDHGFDQINAGWLKT